MLNLFHSSNSKFEEFKISKELSNTELKQLKQGLGVYMSADKSSVENYGKYLYTINIDEKQISDFTNKNYITSLFEKISKEVDVDLLGIIGVDTLVDCLSTGFYPVTNFEDISLLLDSYDMFYFQYSSLLTYDENCLLKKIEKAYFETINDIVKYYDEDLEKDVYVCFRNPENLKISKIKELD